MNYYTDERFNVPFENPITKLACFLGVGYVGYLGVKYAMADDRMPVQRRARQGFTTSKIDHDIDSRNKYFGRAVPSNPDVPHYSRHNYNRRRRSKNFY